MTVRRDTTWHVEAHALREQGFRVGEIARRLGRTSSAVSKALNPGAARAYQRWDNARPGRHEYKLAHERQRLRQPENRGECTNPGCTALRGIGAGVKKAADRGYCVDCVHALADVRRTLAEGMWADGWLHREMAEALGVGAHYFASRREKDGWDLPLRCPWNRPVPA